MSNDKNKPASFTTQLAAKLDLPGQWKVALVDITYPNNWINVPKDINVSIKSRDPPTPPDPDLPRFRPTPKPYKERVQFKITAGQYSITQIVELLQEKIVSITTSQSTLVKVTYNEINRRISIRPNFDIQIGSESKSFFSLIGFEPNVEKLVPQDAEVKLTLSGSVDNTGTKPPQFFEISTMFVYTDIIKPGNVGNTLATLLTYLPITSKYGETGFWYFTLPSYKSVKQQEVNNVYIHLATNTGEEVPFTDGTVTCTLHFVRII